MAEPRTVKVRINWTVEVDIDAWANEYGTGTTAAAVREDVQSYFGAEVIPEHLRGMVRPV